MVIDSTQELIDVAHTSGIPRANIPAFDRMRDQLGLEAANVIDFLQQQELMNTLDRDPRLVQPVISKGVLVSNLRRLVPHSDASVVFLNDYPHTVTPFSCDTKLHTSLFEGREMYRRENRSGVNLAHVKDDFRLDKLIAVFDTNGRAVGSVSYTNTDQDGNQIPKLKSHSDALRDLHAPLLKNRNDEQLSHLYEIADVYFGPDTDYSKQTGRSITFERFLSIEHAFGLLELFDKYRNDPETMKQIYSLAGNSIGEALLQLCETKEDIQNASKLVSDDIETAFHIAHTLVVIEEDTTAYNSENVLPFEKPIQHTIYRIGRSLARSALSDGLRNDETKNMYIQSCAALYESLNDLFSLEQGNGQPVLNAEHLWFEELSKFVERDSGNSIKLGLIEPIIERYFLKKLDRIKPGFMKTDRERFYSLILADLNGHSEATGDDKMQLDLEISTINEMIRLGYWKAGDLYADHLCGDRKRILGPYLKHLKTLNASPGRTIGIDVMNFPVHEDERVDFIQGDLTNPGYLDAIAQKLGVKSSAELLRLITNMWSGLNDNDPLEQEIMMILASTSLKMKTKDSPGGIYFLEVPMGKYIDQMIEIAEKKGLSEMGEAILKYPTNSGEMIKQLEIVLIPDMVQRLKDAGMRVLNIGDTPDFNVPYTYTTSSGVPRMVYVCERVGMPVPSAALAKVLTDYESTDKTERKITQNQYIFLMDLFYDKKVTFEGSSG